MTTKQFDLNVLATPRYTVKLPSSGKELQMRTMLAKEHKALLIAQESDDKIDAIEQCLENCMIGDVKMEDLTVGDAEYLFIQMYINSNGVSTIKARYNCCAEKPVDQLEEHKDEPPVDADEIFNAIVNQTDEEAIDKIFEQPDHLCGTEIIANIDLKKAFVPEFKGNHLIRANDNVVLNLKHPTIRVYENNDPNTPQGLFNIAVECINEVHVGDTVYTKAELKDQNMLIEIMGQIDTATYKKVQEFIDDVPRITTYLDVICPVCGNEEKVTLRGIEDFFI